MKQEILDYLKEEVRFRERSAKWRGIADIIKKKYNLDIDRVKLADILAEASSADRYWRLALKENPELRGADYDDGEILAQKKELELGFSPNYFQDVRKLKTL